jgi:hypothetical protein
MSAPCQITAEARPRYIEAAMIKGGILMKNIVGDTLNELIMENDRSLVRKG